MSARHGEVPPCAGLYAGDGCGVFERFFGNEVTDIENAGESDRRAKLLNNPAALRRLLLREFITAEPASFCPRLRNNRGRLTLPEGVVRLREDPPLFSDCRFLDVPFPMYHQPRLIDPYDMARMLDVPKPNGELRDEDVSLHTFYGDEVFQDRIISHRSTMRDKRKNISTRMESAGSLLFHYYDAPSADEIKDQFVARMRVVSQDDLGVYDLKIEEWTAWHKILVGLKNTDCLNDTTIKMFMGVQLLGEIGLSLEEAKRMINQSYKTLTILMHDEVARRSGEKAELLASSITETADWLVSLLAELYGVDKDILSKDFTPTGEDFTNEEDVSDPSPPNLRLM